ncbi:MAG: efflux RND transporter permease subunit [Bacillota bacterium]
MRITELSLKRPSLTAVVFISLLVLGLFSYGRLPADLLPKMQFPFVVVTVAYPGAGPEDVEKKITKPLEDAMSSLNNLEKITSISQEGMSMVWLEFKLDTDPDVAVNEVQRTYNASVYELPPEAEPGVIQQYNINDFPVMQLSLSGERPPGEMYDLAKNQIVTQLQQLKGISRVMLLGGKEREIQVEVLPERLQAYRLSILQIMEALQADNKNAPVGRIERNDQKFLVRVQSQVSKADQLNEIIVAQTPGGPVHLRDVARVTDTYKDSESIIRLNGQDGIGLLIFKRSDANTIDISDRVLKKISELENNYGVKISVGHNSANFIRDSLKGVQEELFMAIIIVALVIFVFLGNWRGSLIILLSIPVSLISTLLFMLAFGFSINLMSLMGMGLVVGIIVDDSIVVLENIQRHRDRGDGRINAVINSVREIGMAVVSITLTLVVVFLPVALVQGVAGKIFREFGLVVVCATMLSLAVSLTLIPLLAARLVKRENNGNKAEKQFGKGFALMVQNMGNNYVSGIMWALKHKKTVLAICFICMLFSGSLLPLGALGTEFMPKSDFGEFVLKLTAPPGTTLAAMDSLVKSIEKEIEQIPEVKTYYTSVGYATGGYDAGTSANIAEIKLVLNGLDSEVNDGVKKKVKEIAQRKAGVESSIVLSSIFGSANDADLRLEIRGNNFTTLKEWTETIREVVAEIPGTRDVRTTIESGLPQYNIRIDRETAAAHGIFAGDVMNTAGLFINGKVVSKFSDGEDQYDIRLIGSREARNDTLDISRLLVTGQAGQQVQLGQLARFNQDEGLKQIVRTARQRQFVVNANLDGRSLGDVVAEVKERLKDKKVPPDVNIIFEGDQKMFEDSMKDLLVAMALSCIFVYLIMVALFESFLLPLTIWFSVPLAMVGALISLAVTGQTLNIFSMIGLIMLVGLVTKNAILLVDFANNLRKQGLSVSDALVKAGATRLRPIVMTTVAMTLAMLPMALGLSAGSEMRMGMSIALIGGLISSTLLTLFVVPVVYNILEILKERAYGKIAGSGNNAIGR